MALLLLARFVDSFFESTASSLPLLAAVLQAVCIQCSRHCPLTAPVTGELLRFAGTDLYTVKYSTISIARYRTEPAYDARKR
jgi:hypothetical protein